MGVVDVEHQYLLQNVRKLMLINVELEKLLQNKL